MTPAVVGEDRGRAGSNVRGQDFGGKRIAFDEKKNRRPCVGKPCAFV